MRTLLMVILMLCSARALAWVCGAGDVGNEFERADAVFMASVVSNEVVALPQGGKQRRVRLRVIQQWKDDGKELDEVILDPFSECGTVLYLNTTYLIFGLRYNNGDLAADQYSSTTPIYWDGRCPAEELPCQAASEKAASILSFLRLRRGK